MLNLVIDGISVQAREGTKILWAALDAGIYIPHLCAIREADPPFAGCRLCLVEIEQRPGLVAACAEPVAEGMVVRTNTPRVNRVRRTAFQLLLSNHAIVCPRCFKNRNCELQELAPRLGIKLKQRRFKKLPRSFPVDSSHPLFSYDSNMCILCGKCVWLCNERGSGDLNFAFRGMKTMVSTFGNVPLKDSNCKNCGECVAACPVAALIPKTIKAVSPSCQQ